MVTSGQDRIERQLAAILAAFSVRAQQRSAGPAMSSGKMLLARCTDEEIRPTEVPLA